MIVTLALVVASITAVATTEIYAKIVDEAQAKAAHNFAKLFKK